LFISSTCLLDSPEDAYTRSYKFPDKHHTTLNPSGTYCAWINLLLTGVHYASIVADIEALISNVSCMHGSVKTEVNYAPLFFSVTGDSIDL